MCGICGSVGCADEEAIGRMNAVQTHRGPDGEGLRLFRSSDGTVPAALGHRRLSIIDLSDRGAQPMSYAEGRYWVTYNGELYNFRELRADLEADGFRFRSNCDTEVLLAMYARHGEAMLERLNGIFAFAIWDAERRELFLARDRLGVKPLYYAQHDGVFHFASEVKALLQVLPAPSLSRGALAEYLTFLWVPDPDTLFEGIYKVPPGHSALYADGQLRIKPYWDMSFAPEERRATRHWPARVRTGVQAAIRRQLVADVPLGSFLSGGLDSGAVVATMRDAADEVTTYTVGFSEQDLAHEIVPDDLRYARRLARELGLDHHQRILRPDIVDLLPRLVWHMDEPVADPAAITTYLICSAARERLTVILSGMGGDEVFAGYPRYLAARLTRPADLIPRSARAALREWLDGRLTMGRPGRMRGPRRNLMKLLRGIDQPPLDRYLTYSSYYRREELTSIFSDELRAELSARDPFLRHREHASVVEGEHWLNQLLYIDLKTYLPCLNLTYTDKMSMAASTEVRVPLLDDEVVDLAGRIPPSLKLRYTTRKYVLKRSMEGVLPREIIWRPKAGFGAPLRAWMARELRPLIDDCLSPETIRARGLFDPAAVQSLIRHNDAGTADNALRIWALLVLELWQRTFLDATSGSQRVHRPVTAQTVTR
jgi:asparagine synthase (glutamine-hydrolysing)